MRVLSAISSPAQDDVIEKILKARGEWDPPWLRQRASPTARAPPQQGGDDDFWHEGLDRAGEECQLPPEELAEQSGSSAHLQEDV